MTSDANEEQTISRSKEGVYRPTAAQRKLRTLIRDKSRILAYGGSRSGKTFEFVRALVVLALRYGGRYAIFRRYFSAVKNSVFFDTFPNVMRTCFPTVPFERNLVDALVKFPNGAEIWFLGLDDKERVEKVLGREFSAIYFNECSEISYDSVEIALTRLSQRRTDAFGKPLRNRAFFDCNPPGKTHWTHRLFIEGVRPVSRRPIVSPERFGVVQINPRDNAENLPSGYIEETLGSTSEKNRKRFLLGEFGDENENALWKASTSIDPFRVAQAPNDLERIVVAVDPAVTSAEASDATGIVVAGKRLERDGIEHFYVLDDRSTVAPPNVWATEVVDAFERWRADSVVAEVNQGGDLVTATLQNVAPNLPVKTTRATRGKIVRAEPVAVLYEQGRVHHVGAFEELEEEMTSYVGAVGEKSPDRMDALVWALTELTQSSEIATGRLYFG